MTDYASLLNPEQLAAVVADDGPMLVLAAAGTGKTRTLVYRVAYLIERGESPDGLLLLTFTNRAANEMLDRARELAGPEVGELWSGTFHHVCSRFLHRFGTKLGYSNNFAILDRDDSRKLIDTSIREIVGKPGREFPKKDIIAALIGKAANMGCDIADLPALESGGLEEFREEIISIANSYASSKREMDAMDFDDLLVNGLALLERYPDIRGYYSDKFHHVLVDEYQDTNMLQARIVDILASKHRNVMAVGDDFQCIYSWRGADFRNIMDFPKRWPNCSIVRLERNYRSTPEILSVANACIKGNPEQFQKKLRPTRESGVKPLLYSLRDSDEQAESVINLVQRYRDNGFRLRDMAVLYRAHYHSIELQMMMTRARLPFVITSGISVFEQAHTKDVLSFLRVCENRADMLAFHRLLQMLDGIGEKGAEKLWAKLGRQFDSRDKAQRETLINTMRPAARSQWMPIDRLLGEYHDESLVTWGGEAVERFCTLFYGAYLKRKYENAAEREEDVLELGAMITKNENGVSGFLQEVALLTNIDHEYDRDQRNKQDRLYLSTVHQAKGLEWPIIFIVWATDGMFPSSRAIEEIENVAEERRLFYVAVTRAKEALVLCAPAWRNIRDGGRFPCQVSRFIKEIPQDLIKEKFGGVRSYEMGYL